RIYDTDVICKSWNTFCKEQDAPSLDTFIDSLKRFDTSSLNNNISLKESTKNQIELCIFTAERLRPFIVEKEKHRQEIFTAVHTIDTIFMSFLKNKNASLEETHKNLYVLFIYFTLTIVIGGAILIILNIKEGLKKDKIIYSSQALLQHSILVQETERKRISRELHDSVAQNLRYVSLLAENLSDKTAAAKIIETQNQNIEDIRNLCYNLTPPAITKDNILSLINMLAHKIFDADFTFRLVAENRIGFSQFGSEDLLNIYRIIQEALQNIKNHAKASEVTVFFKKNGSDAKTNHLKIIISDDGIGMDEELVKEINSGIFEKTKESHFGIRNICERARLLNGKVTFSSAPDFGTHITVEI
nr:hypothetical protein [Treponema sp.]